MFDTQTAGAFSCCKVYGCCCKQQEHVKWYFSGYIKQKLVAFTGSRDKKADERKGKTSGLDSMNYMYIVMCCFFKKDNIETRMIQQSFITTQNTSGQMKEKEKCCQVLKIFTV